MKNILKIIKLSRPLLPLFSIISVLVVISAVVELVYPLIIKYAIDEVELKIKFAQHPIDRLLRLW